MGHTIPYIKGVPEAETVSPKMLRLEVLIGVMSTVEKSQEGRRVGNGWLAIVRSGDVPIMTVHLPLCLDSLVVWDLRHRYSTRKTESN
jgi:hypothetical protein